MIDLIDWILGDKDRVLLCGMILGFIHAQIIYMLIALFKSKREPQNEY